MYSSKIDPHLNRGSGDIQVCGISILRMMTLVDSELDSRGCPPSALKLYLRLSILSQDEYCNLAVGIMVWLGRIPKEEWEIIPHSHSVIVIRFSGNVGYENSCKIPFGGCLALPDTEPCRRLALPLFQ